MPPKPFIRPGWPIIRNLWHIETPFMKFMTIWGKWKSSLAYLAFQHPQWIPEATERKRKCSIVCKACIAFFPTWSLTQLPTQFLEFYWFWMLSWIRNFLATNGNGYDNSWLSDDIHRGSRQIHDKWLCFTYPSCTWSQNGLAVKISVKPL